MTPAQGSIMKTPRHLNERRATGESSRFLGASTAKTALTLSLVGATFLLTGIGCTRQKYRKDADAEVYNLLNTVDKTSEKYWEMDGFTLQESCNSRYANRYDLDNQPSPIDDQVSAKLLGDVEGPKGRKKWSENGFTNTVENENWRKTLPEPNENGEIVLDQKTAFDLALLHSPDYRTALENVYNCALAVTAERYAFDVKFYGGSSLFYDHSGRFKDGSSRLSAETFSGGFNRKFATGADAVVSLANSLVWTFNPGDQSMTPTTSLSYSFTQPFLRGAGRAIVLEDLTRSERRLLANVRQLAFYQQGFYVGVLTGSSPVSAPTSGGYPGQGVGNTSVSGFYGLLSSQVKITNQESNVASSADNYQRYEEYFATSRVTNRTEVDRMRQNWLSSQKNLIELKNNYRDSIESYLIDLGLPPDIDNIVVKDALTEQFNLMPGTLEDFQSDISTLLAWLRNKNNVVVGDEAQRFVESIKQTSGQSAVNNLSLADLRQIFGDFDRQYALGLQETNEDVVRLETEVSPRRRAALEAIRARFELDNPTLDSSFADYAQFDARVAAIRDDLDRQQEELSETGTVLKERGAKYNIAKMLDLIRLTILTYTPDDLAQMIAYQREHPDVAVFPSNVMQLVSDLHMTSDLIDPIQFNADAIEAELAELDKMAENLTDENRREYMQRRAALEKTVSNLHSGTLVRRDVYRYWFSTCLTKLSEQLMTLRLIQARARLETIELSTVAVDPTLAFAVARERRLDWMNARASLVDEWRNIGIVADQLRSDLKVSVGGRIENEGSNPLNFSAKNSSFSTGVQFDAPLDRFLERNSYRRQLITYDQARRRYYAYVDGVQQQIRSAVRAIELAQISFELERDSVLTSIKRVHSAQLDLTKPPTGQSRIGAVSTSAEALTNALETLLNSQNTIMQTWLQYQSRRMNLMLMMGVFDLDETGRWIDPGNIDADLLQTYLASVERSQDSLAGVDRLPSFEQLSGGRSVEEVRRMEAEAPIEALTDESRGAAVQTLDELTGYTPAQTTAPYAQNVGGTAQVQETEAEAPLMLQAPTENVATLETTTPQAQNANGTFQPPLTIPRQNRTSNVATMQTEPLRR